MTTVSDKNDPTTEGSHMSAPTVAEQQSSQFDSHVVLPMPPQDGFTADDLDRIPDLPPHTELIDGNLVLVSPQKRFHLRMLRSLELQMLEQLPQGLALERELTVVMDDERQRPEPDLVIVHSDDPDDMDITRVSADEVRLAVEVMSPESKVRDRKRKPEIYAEAGIPHYWLIEQAEGAEAIAYVYALDPVHTKYVMTGIHHGRLKVSAPCDLDLELMAHRARH